MICTWRTWTPGRKVSRAKLHEDQAAAEWRMNRQYGIKGGPLSRPVFDGGVDPCPDCKRGHRRACADDGYPETVPGNSKEKTAWQAADLYCPHCDTLTPRLKVTHQKVLGSLEKDVPGRSHAALVRDQVNAGWYSGQYFVTGGMARMVAPAGPAMPDRVRGLAAEIDMLLDAAAKAGSLAGATGGELRVRAEGLAEELTAVIDDRWPYVRDGGDEWHEQLYGLMDLFGALYHCRMLSRAA